MNAERLATIITALESALAGANDRLTMVGGWEKERAANLARFTLALDGIRAHMAPGMDAEDIERRLQDLGEPTTPADWDLRFKDLDRATTRWESGLTEARAQLEALMESGPGIDRLSELTTLIESASVSGDDDPSAEEGEPLPDFAWLDDLDSGEDDWADGEDSADPAAGNGAASAAGEPELSVETIDQMTAQMADVHAKMNQAFAEGEVRDREKRDALAGALELARQLTDVV